MSDLSNSIHHRQAKPQQIHQDMTHSIATLATFRWDQVGGLGLAFRVEFPAFFCHLATKETIDVYKPLVDVI